jgi:modulator of FtsH protease
MEAAFNPEHWSDFFVAGAGANAALAGLVIVAISINLKAIVESRLLSMRAGETVIMLGGGLVVCMLSLVPGQPVTVLGGEVLVLGLLLAGTMRLIFHKAKRGEDGNEKRWVRILLNYGASFPLVLCGISLLGWHGGGGLYWLVPAVLMAMLGGLINSWILLVEILR